MIEPIITKINYFPPYWIVYNPDDSVRCQCGSEYDAKIICRLNPECRYSLVKWIEDQIVDVTSQSQYEKSLPEQKILRGSVMELNQSDQVPLNL